MISMQLNIKISESTDVHVCIYTQIRTHYRLNLDGKFLDNHHNNVSDSVNCQ